MGEEAGGSGFVGALEELSDPASAAEARARAAAGIDDRGGDGDGGGRRPSRRQLLVGAGALLAGGGAWALSRPRSRPPVAAGPPEQSAQPPRPSGRTVLWTYQGTGSYTLARFDQPPALPVFLTDGGLTGLDPATGRPRCHLDLAKDVMLVVDGGRVFCGSGASSTPTSRVDRFELATGRADWTYSVPAPADLQPLACDGTVVYCRNDRLGSDLTGSTLLALSVQDHGTRWSLSAAAKDSLLLSAAVAPGGRLLCTDTSTQLVAVDATDGRRLWTAPVDGYHGRQSADEQHVYLVPGGTGVQALKAADGTPGWRLAPSPDASWHYLPPVVGAGVVYLLTSEGRVTAHTAGDGRQLWSAALPFMLDSSTRPVLVAGALVVPGSADGGVVALDAATGAVRWTFGDSSPGVGLWTVSTDGQRVFAGRDAYLHALPATG